MHQFIAINYSPWSEKARWALDLHRVPYQEQAYVPMLGEPALRLRLKRLTGRVTVPVLFADDGRILDGSLAIARFADLAGAVGDGAPLFPAAALGDITRWNTLSDAILEAGRALSVAKAMDDPAARIESVPRLVPAPLRPLVGQVGVVYLRKKYKLAFDREAALATMTAGLRELREALGGRPYLGDTLSYADLTMAVSLQLAAPVSDDYIRLGPATRRVCTEARILDELADVVAWRDRLYAKHRRPS